MPDDAIITAVRRITVDEPDKDELRALEQELRTAPSGSDTTIERYALAGIIDSILSYLAHVDQNLAKSVGLRTADERQRIFNSLSQPTVSDPQGQIEDLLYQWESIQKYSREDIEQTVSRQCASN